MEAKITKKEITFRKVKCKVLFHEYECTVTVGVKGKREATGSYPPWYNKKKEYLIMLLKKAT